MALDFHKEFQEIWTAGIPSVQVSSNVVANGSLVCDYGIQVRRSLKEFNFL